jgi:hypothetical protein
VLDYHIPPPGVPGGRRWSWIGRITAAVAWAACVVGTALIFHEVESVIGTGPVLAGLGVILLIAGVVARRTLWTLLGTAHVSVCLLFFGLVNLLEWDPSDAEMPFRVMSVLYTMASAVSSFFAVRIAAAGTPPDRMRARWPLILLLAPAWLAGAGCYTQPAADDTDARAGRVRPKPPPQGFVPAYAAGTDPVTGLPTRVVHQASGIMLVLIPAGEFLMGSPDDEPGRSNRERLHRRVIRKPFYLGQTEVTVAQFRRFVRSTGYQTNAERGVPDNDQRRPGGFASTPDGDRAWNDSAS